MKNTRFMERLFSAMENNEEEVASQVAEDIENASANGEVDSDELNYKANPDGSVNVTDKENGEVTVVEKNDEGGYDLYPAEVSTQIEGYLHPEGDGVTPGQQQGAPDEHVEDHPELENGVAASNPEERSAEAEAQAGPEGEGEIVAEEKEEQVEFSVVPNSAALRVFNDQIFMERIFSEVIESEETAKVGSLKIEKVPEENAVVISDLSTGDQAKVTMEDNEMEIDELDSKNFCNDCGCEDGECGIDNELELGGQQDLPLHVVGLDQGNFQLVDAPCGSEEDAQALANQLTEAGVSGVQIFGDADSARDYAMQLLEGLGADEVAEPEQAEFSDCEEIYVTRFYSNTSTTFMVKLFSEGLDGIDASQSAIEDAIENGDEIETDTEVITPIDSTTAIVEEKDGDGDYTKVTISGEDIECEPISEDEADELFDGIEVEEDGVDEDEEEKEFSNIWTNEAEDRFFSEHEEMNAYMQRLFSEEADSEDIEDSIESGEQVETDNEIITPVDSTTAVIEDKSTGEFTKAVMDDEKLDVNPISEEEADELTDGLAVAEDEDEEEKEFSQIWTNEAETRFFSENETMTAYMQRLFSEEADQDEIEDSIESGEQIETDTEVITPVDSCTAVIEDKNTGEFTKATICNEEDMKVEAISEDEADELTDGLAVEENDDTENQKAFSDSPVLTKFFNEMYDQQAAQAGVDPAAEEGKPSVEQVEDKALAAVQQIQEAAEMAVQTIQEAKEAPVEGQEEDLREATFSEKENTIIDSNNTALSWLGQNLGK